MLEIYQELVSVISKGETAVLATIISSQGSTPRKAGAKMLIKGDGSFIGTIGGGGTEHHIMAKVKEVMQSGKPQIVHFDISGQDKSLGMICGGTMDVFLEPIMRPETLYLFGAGHTAQRTAATARGLGFRVIIIDPRPEYNNRDRFPEADELIVEEYDKVFPKLSVDDNSYIVIYTTGHVIDEKCLSFAIGTRARYIGMIGSKKKAIEVKEHLREKGASSKELDRVHSPIGLEIGAETPDEIAISIIAEIIKVRRGQSAE